MAKKIDSNLVYPSSSLNSIRSGDGEGKYRSFIENLPVLFYAVEPVPPYSPLYVSPAFEKFG